MTVPVGLTPVEMHDQLLASMVDGARHDTSLCPFCNGRDSASEQAQPPASVPSGSQPSGASTPTTAPTMEGGTEMTAPTDNKMTVETHEALQAKAVSDAVAATDSALQSVTKERDEAKESAAKLQGELDAAMADNKRINTELDDAQVKLKTATDEVASLKEAETSREQAAKLEAAAKTRAEEVTKLGVFPEDYVTEKASGWAAMSDEDWASRLEEWAKLKPNGSKGTDTASAMTGTTGKTTTDAPADQASADEVPLRRKVLDLGAK